MSITSRKHFITLAIVVIVWYLALAYLPQIDGTCFDGACEFSPGKIIGSFAAPLMVIAGNGALPQKPVAGAASQLTIHP